MWIRINTTGNLPKQISTTHTHPPTTEAFPYNYFCMCLCKIYVYVFVFTFDMVLLKRVCLCARSVDDFMNESFSYVIHSENTHTMIHTTLTYINYREDRKETCSILIGFSFGYFRCELKSVQFVFFIRIRNFFSLRMQI